MNFLALVANKLSEVAALITSAGAADAGKVVGLDASGRLDVSLMPVGIAPEVKIAPATEALAAGDYVNLYDNAGLAVRKASAADGTKPANGFVLNNVTLGQPATVYLEGINTALTGLTPGSVYVLSAATPGAVVALAAAPAANGNILQVVGTTTATNEISTMIEQPIVRVV